MAPGSVKRERSISSNEKTGSKHYVDACTLDTAAILVAAEDITLTLEEAKRLRRKIDWHILPLMFILYWVQFMDKTTLGYSAILGIRKDANLTTNEYNWLGTVFYLAYLVFEYPQNLALQRFPVGKWMSINILVWSIALLCHAACKNFTGLVIVRAILGACEGSITAGFLIVSSMFYTRTEQTLIIGYWFLMNGTAVIITGFISFGVLHTKTNGFAPWQWLMVITGSITVVTGVLYWFLFPDSPTNAWFLTPEERAKAVLRIKGNQTGVENKTFKKEQVIETLKDPKTWLFALFTVLANVPNSLLNQRTIIVTSFGWTPLQTTLFGCIDGVIEVITIFVGVQLAARIPNSRAYIITLCAIPSLLGCLLVTLLPWENRVGLLCAIWTLGVGLTGFVLVLSWVTSVTAGHTKRITTNTILLIAYCVGNSVAPFMWQDKYRPRNYVPWGIIGGCFVVCGIIPQVLRWILARENALRDREEHDPTYDDIYIEHITLENKKIEVKVPKEFLDLTDRQNRDFRYVL